jgi:hypothetical protein
LAMDKQYRAVTKRTKKISLRGLKRIINTYICILSIFLVSPKNIYVSSISIIDLISLILIFYL